MPVRQDSLEEWQSQSEGQDYREVLGSRDSGGQNQAFFEGFQEGCRKRVDQVYKCRGLGPEVNSRNYPVLPHSWKEKALIKPKQILSSQMKTT